MNFKQKHPWILASTSPRRAEILSLYRFKFSAVSPDFDEEAANWSHPEEEAIRLAEGKARSVAAEAPPGRLVIASDTVVVFDGEALCKPSDEDENFSFLKRLSGVEHKVISSYYALETDTQDAFKGFRQSLVRFRSYPDHILQAYAASGEGLGKAGGYAIQGVGGFLVESFSGSYSNIVGFPVEDFISSMLGKGWLSV